MKQRAENALKVIADDYRRLLSERLATELEMIDVAEATGNAAAAQHHRVVAEVYRSMLMASRQFKPVHEKSRLYVCLYQKDIYRLRRACKLKSLKNRAVK